MTVLKETLIFSNGVEIPLIGLGVWQMSQEEAEKSVEVEKIIEIPKEIIKKVKKPRKKKEKVVKEKPVIEEIISESVQTKPEVEQNASLKNSKKSTTSFTQKTGFYK